MNEQDTLESTNNLCYKIAYNIFSDNDIALSLASSASKPISNSKKSSSMELEARHLRHIAFQKYLSEYYTNDKQPSTPNMISIMDELETALGEQIADNRSESVIALQLSDSVDKYVRTLKVNEQIIYIKRYFFADSLEGIANSTNLSIDKVKDILFKCNNDLNRILCDKKIIAKKETLFISFTDIGDDLIDISEGIVTSDSQSNDSRDDDLEQNNTVNKSSLSKYIAIFAGVFIVAIIGIVLISSLGSDKKTGNDETNQTNAIRPTHREIDSKYEHLLDRNNPYGDTVVIPNLLYFLYNTQNFDKTVHLKTEGLVITYHSLSLRETDILQYCIGNECTDFSNSENKYYTLLGHDEYEYLIEKNDNGYTLFEINSYNITDNNGTENTPEYTLGYILKEIYGIYNVDNISEAICTHYTNSFAHISISDRDKIAEIFNVIKDVTFSDTTLQALYDNKTYDSRYLFGISTDITFTTTNGTSFSIFYNYKDKFLWDTSINKVLNNLDTNEHETLNEIFQFPEVVTLNPYSLYEPETWNFKLTANGATSKQLSLGFTHPAPQAVVDLYSDGTYILERQDNGTWTEVPILDDYEEKDAERVYINKYDEHHISLFFNDKYGELPNGDYRISVVIYNADPNYSNSMANHTFSAEFTIDSMLELGSIPSNELIK